MGKVTLVTGATSGIRFRHTWPTSIGRTRCAAGPYRHSIR